LQNFLLAPNIYFNISNTSQLIANLTMDNHTHIAEVIKHIKVNDWRLIICIGEFQKGGIPCKIFI
jgi:hypothetical protein